MSHHDLIDRVAELLHERPGQLRDAGVTNERNLQGWLAEPSYSSRSTPRAPPAACRTPRQAPAATM